MQAATEQETQLRGNRSTRHDESDVEVCLVAIEIHDQMFHVEIEIFKTRSRIKQWTKYRDVTRDEEQRAIQSLKRELAYMIDNHGVLSRRCPLIVRELNRGCPSEYLERTAREERSAMTQVAQDKIDQKTRAAIERVAMGLDRFTKRMLSENQYMHEEVRRGRCSSLVAPMSL